MIFSSKSRFCFLGKIFQNVVWWIFHSELTVNLQQTTFWNVLIFFFFFFSLYILPYALLDILGRCTLYTPGCRMKAYKKPFRITVAFFNLHRLWLSLHRGPPVNVRIQRTAHCFHVIPANDTNESVFRHRKFPCPSLGSILVPLAQVCSPLSYHAFYFFLETGFDISCKLSPNGDNLHEMQHLVAILSPICIKCQIQFSNLSKMKISSFAIASVQLFIFCCGRDFYTHAPCNKS